ncbi:glutathione S-transferase 1-like isoform X2 [Helicoverpa zea]|uniref:glutathione S-transferase 1-like isoform X2 n=1 Tax=Helicoverpa zea TaxID=7113 RepID=UPI001F5ADA51|nr:glutathione S-transferase 1-like isoform X2 [Helicoverpa zea]
MGTFMAYSSNMLGKAKPILYGDVASPPVRFAMMTASILNIDYDFHNIDLFKAENNTDSYKKINPLKKVPALSVNGEFIRDSHAIALYFCRNSGNQELYPEDSILRAKIDEWLYFDAGVMFPIDSAIFTEYFAGKWPADEAKVKNWYLSLDHLEHTLGTQKWLTGDKIRLCDICCAASVSSLEILVPLSEQHNKVKEWLESLKSLPCFEINTRGLQRLQGFVRKVVS